MNSFVEVEAKTVDEAIDNALKELCIDREQAEIEIIEEGSKGILGILGGKSARVKVCKKDNVNELICDFLNPILKKMQIDANIEIEEYDDFIKVDLSGENIGIIIGHRGETLDSLQYLLSLITNKNRNNYKRVILDVEHYRQKRRETLERLANRLADKVYKTRRNVTLEPMNPYERRIIHSTLQGSKTVTTFSIGEEPNRKVIIKIK